MAINWNMPGPQNNALAYFQFGKQLGDQVYERKRENELMALRQKQVEAQTAKEQAAAQRAQQEQRRADMPLVTRLIESSVDEASYQRNRAIAQEYGIDTASLPQSFDPAWRDQQLATLKALQDPQAQEALSAAGKIAVDMGLKPGTREFNQRVTEIFLAQESKPYVSGGTTRLSIPRLGGGASDAGIGEGATATNPQTGEKIIFQGGQWVPMGGGASNGTGGFPPR